MHKILPVFAAVVIAVSSAALLAEENTTKATEVDAAALEVRATQAVNAKEWTTALPILTLPRL